MVDPRVVLPSLLVLLGCPEPGTDSPCQDDSGPSLVLGTGETSFVPLEGSPPELELIHGPQGGYHLLLGFQAKNVDSNHFVSIEATGHIDGELRASSERWASIQCNPDSGYSEGFNFFLIYDGVPETLADQLTDIEVLLRDNDGIEVTAGFTARIIDTVNELEDP